MPTYPYGVRDSGSVRSRKGVQDRTDPMNRHSRMYPPYEWGMTSNPQGGQAPGQHKAQPLLQSWRGVRAQIGTRPVQRTPRGDAGQSYGQLSGTITPKTAPYSVAGAVRSPIDEGPFFYGPEVIHIQRFFRAANTGYSGPQTIGRSAAWNGITAPGGSASGGSGDNFTVLKRPLQRFPTRGPRSVSGANNRKQRFDDLGRIPSVFVPTTPLR